MKAISLPVLFLNGSDIQLTELGVKSEDDCVPEIKTVLFYNIDALSPYTHNGQQYTCIHTAAQDFICPKSIDQVEKILNGVFMNIDKTSFENETPYCGETAVSGWVAVTERLPKPLQTVWLTNGKGWCCLGCLVEDAEGSHWAESNGVIYIENGKIVSECESDDLDVNYWHELPKPPCQ